MCLGLASGTTDDLSLAIYDWQYEHMGREGGSLSLKCVVNRPVVLKVWLHRETAGIQTGGW